MVVKSFYLLGRDPSKDENIHLVEIDITHDLDAAKSYVADSFSILSPASVGFQTLDAQFIPDLDTLLDAEQPIAVTVDGHAVRKVPGPKGLPIVGSYYEVYPDHLHNNLRLLEQYGPVIQHTAWGTTTHLTSDPAVASLVFQESPFWSKKIGSTHPLYGSKDNKAGLFLCDTDTEEWRLAHKYLPPALSPKAIRKYVPMTQKAAQKTFKVFDQFADENEAFDIFPYMFKLTSEAVAKLTLDLDLNHFDDPDTPISQFVLNVLEFLELSKKVGEKGSWYSHLPFGEPKRLHETIDTFRGEVIKAIRKAQAKELSDLPIATAAIDSDSMVEYVVRAIDEDGNKIPENVATGALPVVIGAGFGTTSALLSWMLGGVAHHPDIQNKLLQEQIDYGVTADTQWELDSIHELAYLDKYLKEIQRLHNPSFQPARTALRDQIIPGGFEIPKGASLICSIYALHRNPAVWDDPTTFNPDRWDTEKVKKRPVGSYVPFALGPRSCIGFNFALAEAKVMFSTLLYRYEILKYGDENVDYDKQIILIRPNNLYLQLKRRTSWPEKSKSKPTDAAP